MADATFRYGENTFGILGAWAAKNNGDGTYGSAVKIHGINRVSLEMGVLSADRRGDDRVLSAHALVEVGNITVAYHANQMDVFSVLTAFDEYQSGTTSNRQRHLSVTNKPFPYFGLVCLCLAEDDEQVAWWIPKVKITSNTTLMQATYGEVVMVEVSGMAFIDDNFKVGQYGILAKAIQYETRTSQTLTIPPAGWDYTS